MTTRRGHDSPEREAHELRVAEMAPSPREYVAVLLRWAQAAHEPPPSPSPAAPATPGAPQTSEPAAPASEPYHRVELAPGVELHVRADAMDRERTLIDRIIALARGRRRSGGR